MLKDDRRGDGPERGGEQRSGHDMIVGHFALIGPLGEAEAARKRVARDEKTSRVDDKSYPAPGAHALPLPRRFDITHLALLKETDSPPARVVQANRATPVE